MNSQVTKNELGDHDSLLLVHLYGDTLPVIVHRNLVLLPINHNFEIAHGRVVDFVVGSVD